MNNKTPKLKNIVSWPEFRIVWALLALVIVALVIAIMELPQVFAFVEGGILIAVLILVFVAIYGAAAKDRGASVARNELKSIFQGINDALIVYDSGFGVTFFNPAAEKLFNISAADALGHTLSPRDVEKESWRTLAQVIFPSLAPRVIARSHEGELAQVVDITLTDPQWELRVTTVPVIDESGRTLSFMKIIRDRTPQIAALRAKDEFITVASHQLRGPATDINWALQTLAQAKGLDETNKMIVATASGASESLLRRIEDLLSIAKMEDGQFGYKFEDADIVEYIGKSLADVLPAARKAGIKIYFDRPTEAMPHVMIDTKQLSLAMTNVLENAIRYNVENGEVTVKVDRMQDKPFVVISVKDTGIGIPPEDVGKLFTKFYRAGNAVKSQTEGSGLGLYIAKGIVTAHGGQIWAESEVNRGTTVSVALPTDPSLVPQREISAEELV